ncbi:MAG TPA: hypothetical protein VK691_13315 [Solirubrobacteraceae bacterium]|nr:hypothetical protein [Solirubrobacteraceae bacterium]
MAVGAFTAAGASASLSFHPSAGFPVKFSGSGGKAEFESAKNVDVECVGQSVTGEITNLTVVSKMVGTFEKCTTEIGSKCEIKTASLKGTLGYINKSAEQIGLDLEGETKVGSEEPVWGEIKCGEYKAAIKGHVIARITEPPLNKPAYRTMKLAFSETKGVQEPGGFEGGPSGQQLTWKPAAFLEDLGIIEAFPGIITFSGQTLEIKS